MADTLYRPQSIDTSIEADRFVFELLRQTPSVEDLRRTERVKIPQARQDENFALLDKTQMIDHQ